MYALLVLVLSSPITVTRPPNITPLLPVVVIFSIIKESVGGQHCPLTDGTVNCPRENTVIFLSMHVNDIKYNYYINISKIIVNLKYYVHVQVILSKRHNCLLY